MLEYCVSLPAFHVCAYFWRSVQSRCKRGPLRATRLLEQSPANVLGHSESLRGDRITELGLKAKQRIIIRR